MIRLPDALTRPLWPDSPSRRREAVCSFCLIGPFGLLAGSIYGARVAPSLGVPTVWGAVGASLGLLALLYLQARTVPLARALGEGLAGPAAALGAELAWDGLAGGLVGVLLFEGAGAPSVATAGLAVGLGGIYAFLSGVALCGEGPGGVFARLVGLQGSATPGAPDFSFEASLVQRGRYDEAEAAYRARIEEDPGGLAPYFRLARLLQRERVARYEDAARLLEEARERARVGPSGDARLLRELGELWIDRAGEPARAAPALARLLERHPDSPHAGWAREELSRVKALIAREAGLDAEGRPDPEDGAPPD